MPIKFKKLFRSKLSWVVLLFIIIAVVVVIYLLLRGGSVELPQEFLVARENAAVVSSKIVELTSITNDKIKEANSEDLNGNVGGARKLIEEARANNIEAQAQAFELSRHLQKLAESLGAVSKLKSQRLAYEAVAVELALVGEFITYTDNLNDFLNRLTSVLGSGPFGDRSSIQEKLNFVNESALKINSLNKEFLAKIEEFDKSL